MALLHGLLRWRGWEHAPLRGAVDAVSEAFPGLLLDEFVQDRPSDGAAVALMAHRERSATPRAVTRHPSADAIVLADLEIPHREWTTPGLDVARQATDGELVLHAYLDRGRRLPVTIPGRGAFAVWDGQTQRLHVWRDVAGTRPMYYSHRPHHLFAFSSDLRAMVRLPGVRRDIDLAYARSLIEYGPGFQHPERTLLDGICKLPAAHHLCVDRAGLIIRPYWDPEEIEPRPRASDEVYVDELRALLERVIDDHLAKDEATVGAHLSGGLDSTSVATIASRCLARRGGTLVALSWAPPRDTVPPQIRDERDLVESAAQSAGLEATFTTPCFRDLVDLETRDLALRPTTTLQVEMAASRNAAAAGATTVLSGWGGDEFVVNNGRGYFASLAQRGRWWTAWRELHRRSAMHEGSMASEFRGRVLLPLLPDGVAYRLRPDLRPQRLAPPRYLRPVAYDALSSVDPLPFPHLRERAGVRAQQIEKLRFGHLQYRAESWASHGTDVGIRYRYPLLDRRIIEFALSIPDHLYFRDGWKRWLFRVAMEGILPDDVRWNPDKLDAAMSAGLKEGYAAARSEMRERLRRQEDNAYIDVRQVLESPSTHAPNVGSAVFLAFTSARAPW